MSGERVARRRASPKAQSPKPKAQSPMLKAQSSNAQSSRLRAQSHSPEPSTFGRRTSHMNHTHDATPPPRRGRAAAFNTPNRFERLHVLEDAAALEEDDLRQIQTEFLRSEEHTSELQSRGHLVCRLLLEKKKAAG